MCKGAFFIVVGLWAGSIASASTVYEPVRYQYGSGADTYYYGGRNPHAVAAARQRSCALRYSDPHYAANSFTTYTDRTPAVYSDAAPYMNLSVYGYTPADAMNEAYANVPRYFRKAEILAAGTVLSDGTLVVPANAEPVPAPAAAAPASRPVARAIIIIPKSRLAPAAKPVQLKVASAS